MKPDLKNAGVIDAASALRRGDTDATLVRAGALCDGPRRPMSDRAGSQDRTHAITESRDGPPG